MPIATRCFATCACRTLDPAILMMKPAQNGLSGELAEPLDRPMPWRILP